MSRGPNNEGTLFTRAERVFFEVSGLRGAERLAAIERLCAGDNALHARVHELLASADKVGGFLEQPALGRSAEELARESRSHEPKDDLVGTMLGPFRLTRRLASGGMGTVYDAARADAQFDQRVAVKVIKRGMDSEEIVRRFREERQTLAQLDHPHIARLLDGGVTGDGRPYLVMEYVEGLPIDQYCNDRKLPTTDRLKLFRLVCEGVHAAHQALVIHRDLKPSNILVTAAGIPKLLDFGIAKVISGGTAAATIESERRLTPEYASPEQVEGLPLTTASDVYALGVILYELLAGTRPYEFSMRSQAEVRRVVCDVLPPMPSESVPTQGGVFGRTRTQRVAPTTAGSSPPRTHGVTPTRLRNLLRGDLDTIVMMALRKEPTRRYASAEQLSADIGRYLGGMPVTARRDTWGYRTGKFVKRNAAAVALGTLAVASLAGGLALQTHQKRVIEENRNELRAANTRQEETRGVLVSILSGAQTSGKGPNATLGEVLQDAAKTLELSPPADDLTLASVREAIGSALMTLGLPERARPLIEAAHTRFQQLPEGSPARFAAEVELAQLLYYEGKFADAEPRLRELLRRERANLKNGAHSTIEGELLNSLGAVLRQQRKLDEALTIQNEALAARTTVHGARSLEVAESLNNIANIDLNAGRYAEAVKGFQAAMDIRASKLRGGHPLIVATAMNLGLAMVRNGTPEPGADMLRQAVNGWESAYGPDHPGNASSRTALAQALRKLGKPDEAIDVLNAGLAWQQRHAAPAASILATRANLGLAVADKGACAATIAALEPVYGDAHFSTFSEGLAKQVRTALADAYAACGRDSDAASVRGAEKKN